MSSVKEIRESVDTKLDKLDARADALQAALEGTQDQVGTRVVRHKQELQSVLGKLTADIGKQTEVSDARKQAIQSMAENLDLQIDLSETASRETLAYTRRQIHEAIRKLETEVDSALAESKTGTAELLHVSIDAYARAVDKLDAELEAAELCFASVKEKADAAFVNRRKELAEDIAKIKQRLGEKKADASEKLADFEAELRGGIEQAVKTFKDLFG